MALARRLGPLGCVGAALVGTWLLIALLAPWISPHPPEALAGPPYAEPSRSHLLGTDDVGHDLLAQLLWGARTSLAVAAGAAALAITIGVLVGGFAAVGPRWFDAVAMRVADVFLMLPFLPVVVISAVFLGQGLGARVALIGLLTWAGPARVIRAGVLGSLGHAHVEVSRAMGATRRWVLRRHTSTTLGILVVPLLVRAATGAVLLDASLAFLGLGDPTTPGWGNTLYWASARGALLDSAWWWAVPPGLALASLGVGLALVGIAAEQRLSPALEARR